MLTTRAIFVSVFVLVSLSLALPAQAFCGTEHPDHAAVSDGVGKRASSCIGTFECNDPTIRDQYLLNGQSPMISVNLNVIYFGQLTGSAKTTYDAQMAFFQQEYAKYMNITWNINLRVVTDKYQSIDATNGGPALRIAGEYYMPGYMTVLLTYFSPNPSSYLGFSFTPQSIDLKNHPEYLYAAVNLAPAGFAPRATALLHEVGHMLGLLHSFTDSPCTQCSENINSDGDVVGDYCSDTKPVWRTSSCTGLNIRNYDCNNVTYTTDLSQLPLDNYMAYTPPSCQTKFTPQQAARARCHLDRLISFVITKPPSAPVAIETPTGTPVTSVPQSATTPQSNTSPQSTSSPVIVPNSENSTPNGSASPAKQNTPSSSLLTSFGSRTLVVTTLVGIICAFVIL